MHSFLSEPLPRNLWPLRQEACREATAVGVQSWAGWLLELRRGAQNAGRLTASRVTINVKHDSVLCRRRDGSGLLDRKEPAMDENRQGCGTPIAGSGFRLGDRGLAESSGQPIGKAQR